MGANSQNGGQQPAKPRRAAIYLRVSTREQSTAMQRAELETIAERAGWDLVEVFEDAGISGAKGRDKRPAFDRMLKDATRRRFDVVMAWSLDRVGRSLQHLVMTLADLQAAGVDLFFAKQAIDTTTSSGRALFGMLSVFAAFERDMIAERVTAGLARAKADGRRLGRRRLSDPEAKRSRGVAAGPALVETIKASLAGGLSIRKTAALHGVGISTVQRLKAAG